MKNIIIVFPVSPSSNATRTKQVKQLLESISSTFGAQINIEIYYNGNEKSGPWISGDYASIWLKNFEVPIVFEKTRFLWRINRFLKENFTSIWSRKVARDITRRFSKGELKVENTVVLTISTPIESHRTALAIKKRIPSLQWFAFFSDVWPADILPKPYFNSDLLKDSRLNTLMKVLIESDKVIVTNEKALSVYQSLVPKENSTKFRILNHFSKVSPKATDTSSAILLHLGSLDLYRVSASNVNLLQELLSRTGLSFTQVGGIGPRVKQMLTKALGSKVRFIPYTTEIESFITASRYVLIVEAEMDSVFIPSKVADYICSGKEIIALTKPDSPTANLLRKFAAGLLVYSGQDGTIQLEKLPRETTDANGYRNHVQSQLENIFH